MSLTQTENANLSNLLACSVFVPRLRSTEIEIEAQQVCSVGSASAPVRYLQRLVGDKLELEKAGKSWKKLAEASWGKTDSCTVSVASPAYHHRHGHHKRRREGYAWHIWGRTSSMSQPWRH